MQETFHKTWKNSELSFKYSSKESDAANDKEFHCYHELIFFMDGTADFITEQNVHRLLPYTLIVLPKNTFHQLIVHGKYVRCVFQFENVSGLNTLIQQKFDSVQLIRKDELTNLFLKYKNFTDLPLTPKEKDAFLTAFFTFVLIGIQKEDCAELSPCSFHPITEKTIAYVNEHTATLTNVSELSNLLSVSPSYLAHVFKADMQIPLYSYLLNKKLLLAHKKLCAGIPANEAALESGFNDYSGFYRQYKKKFGFPPSKTTSKNRK